MIIEDVDDSLSPSIDTVLAKTWYRDKSTNILTVKFADKPIAFHESFRLYLHTKKPNPNYLAEVFIKVNVINFTATFEGLNDQLLAEVVKNERPEIEIKRDENVRNLAGYDKTIKEGEKEILKLLSEAKAETILDNTKLIETLEKSKETSEIVNVKIAESQVLDREIEKVRSSYTSVSTRGSILFFVIKDLSLIDPMYQYSL